MMKHLLLTALVTLSMAGTTLSAAEYTLGDLQIDTPYTRTTPPMAPVAGGFLKITNNGKEDATLVGGKATFSENLEVHEMVMKDNVMKMRQLEDGLVIPAGETVELKPGGYHLMFIKLSEQMKEDDRHKATLSFAREGDIEVEFVVKDISKMMENSEKEGMDHSKHGEMQHEDKSE
ncbi:MAG: copper chaperone PCu(A)C [Thiolinea sp.]